MKKRVLLCLLILSSFVAFGQITASKVKIKPVKGNWEISVKKSKLMLEFPIQNWNLNKINSKGGKDNPRYFYFEDLYQNMVISGYIQNDTSFKGMNTYWENTQAFLKSYGVPEPYEVDKKKLEDWDCIFFDVPLQGGIISNLYANYLKDGTWIEIRISMTTSQSNSVARKDVTKAFKNIKVKNIAAK